MELSTIVVGVMGGLGMFLLGMSLMTEGLKAMAGDAIRTSLRRVTRSPFSGAVIGFVGTAVLQSSSAAVIATIGFVGDRKSTRLNSSHVAISYAVFCLKKKN